MIKQAIIPLAGLGTRLLPLTSVIPKELLPINGKPGIEYILDECIAAGIKEVIFIISKRKEIIKKYFYNDAFFKKVLKNKKNKNIQFEYDKIKNILKAKGNITVNDEANDYIVNSENILYLKDQEKIQIKGKSSSLIFSNYNFKSEDLIILRDKLVLESNKPTTIIDKKSQTLYEIDKFSYYIKEEILKGDNIFINTKFNQPFSDKFFFKSAIFNLKDQS